MAIDWKIQTFESLSKAGNKDEETAEDVELYARCEDVETFPGPDHIWPPMNDSPDRLKFNEALREVLSRLSPDDFCKVKTQICFVVEEPSWKILAVNFPAPPSSDGLGKKSVDTIVFYERGLKLKLESLIWLIAHEIAHSFVSGKTDQEDEAIVNAKAREWGFEREWECFKGEEESLRNKPASGSKS